MSGRLESLPVCWGLNAGRTVRGVACGGGRGAVPSVMAPAGCPPRLAGCSCLETKAIAGTPPRRSAPGAPRRVGYAAGMTRTRGWSKYQVFVDHVAARSASPATYTFTEIERVIGGPLPRIAYTRTWWRSSLRHWRRLHAAGWRVAGVDLPGRTVTFARVTGA